MGGLDFGPDRWVLGLLSGLTYGLLAVGLVLTYRSSRFINFAHGSIGVFGAAVLGLLASAAGAPYWVAFPVALIAAGMLAALVEWAVVRRLRARPRVIGMIATLGLSQFILVIALLLNPAGLSGATFPKPAGFPEFHIGRTPIGPAFTAMLMLTPLLLVGLAVFLRQSRHGLAIRAAADEPDAAALNGVTAPRMATLAWAIAGGIAAFSAILVTPTQGAQSIESLGPDLLLKGLAGAVIARLASIPIAFAASLAIGVVEQILVSSPDGRAMVPVVLGVVILAALLLQPITGRRAELDEGWVRPPDAGRWTWRSGAVAGLAALGAAGLAYVVSNETASVLTSVVGFALVGLSVVLVTGVAGELSLGQFAFAGIGAAVSIGVTAASGNLFVGMVAGCGAAAIAAVLIGMPALRLRGLALGVTTLAFALATSAWLLRQDWLLGDGVRVPKPQWAGYPLELAKDYYLFALLMLGLGLVVVANLRRGGFGRLLTALRDNDDAARSFGVPAPRRKLQAYAIAGALAGLGGAVIGHGQTQLTVNSFPTSASIDVVAVAVVGGISLLIGPVVGALLLIGVPGLVDLGIAGQAVLTLAWLLIVILLPGGLAGWRWRRKRSGTAPAPELPEAGTVSAPAAQVAPDWSRLGSVAAPRSAGPLLSVRALGRSYGGIIAVDEVDLDVRAGEIVGIIGPNGAGKTTLFEMIAGFTRPDAGGVAFAGRDVTRWSPQRRAQVGLVRSFQTARLFPTLTVREALQVAAERRQPTNLLAAALGSPAPDRLRRARAAQQLDLMGLSDVADAPLGSLSTGTRRMAELACLLLLEPRLLLLDEPSSGVAQADGAALADLLLRVNQELGTTLLIIEHDLPLLARLCPRLVAMDSGRIIADGPPDDVRAHPRVVRSYLGTDSAAVHRSGAPAVLVRTSSDGSS